MNRTKALLFKLAEECAEVTQRASKAALFGLDEVQDGQSYNNAQRLRNEIKDIRVIVQMLSEHSSQMPIEYMTAEEYAQRRAKVEHWLSYSAARGHIKEEGAP